MRKLRAQIKSVKPEDTGALKVILWEVEPDMAYTFGLYLYLLVAGVVADIGVRRVQYMVSHYAPKTE